MPAAEPTPVPVYFDSALIAKFYLNEPGRDPVRQVARSAGVVVSSGIAVVEVSAAFHRKLREGAIEVRVYKALQGQFAHDLDTGLWRLAGPTEAVLREAQVAFSRLDKSILVRSLDALHLVTARSEKFDRIYSSDRHVLAAARSFGLHGVDPTTA
jgi:predicted nucleic acid-binding protein